MLAREPLVEIARVGLVSVVVVSLLLLAGAALHADGFDGPAVSTALYLAYCAAAGALALVTLLRRS